MNKRNNTIRGVLLLVAAALMFSSCAETPGPEEEVTDTRTISFGTPALTRSAIDNAGDMQGRKRFLRMGMVRKCGRHGERDSIQQ